MADPWDFARVVREMRRTWSWISESRRRAEHADREWRRGGARRCRGGEVRVLVRCGRCNIVLDELHGAPDGAGMRSVGRGDHIDAFAGPGKPAHGGLLRREDVPGLLQSAELRRYRCPQQRCTADYLVKWETLRAAFRSAAARPAKRDRVIRLPVGAPCPG